MPTRSVKRSIKLTPHFDELVRQKIASGRYESASDVIRDGLRLLEHRDGETEQMRQDIELGWKQAQRGELHDGGKVFEEIRALSRRRRVNGATAR